MFGSKVKKENEELKHRLANMEALFESMGGGDLVKLKDTRDSLLQTISELKNYEDSMRKKIEESSSEFDRLTNQVIEVRTDLDLQNAGFYDFKNPAEESVELKEALEKTKRAAKMAVSNKHAVIATNNFTFNNSAAKGKSFVNQMCRVALRSYNAEVENAIVRVKAGNLQTAKKRIERARNQVQTMGRMIDLQISERYHQLRLEELELAHKHMVAKKLAKEAEREERARLREEAKAQAELKKELERLRKEENHYSNTLNSLLAQGREDEAAQFKERLEELQHSINDVDYRAANIRAGYVYVISNVGSFGQGVAKIGLTRRLQPMDRVRELGDASVPFNFDVHVLYFSKDAVGVEAELHRRFHSKRVNLVNNRREFFYATPAEVKQAMLEIDGSILEYVEEPEAEQFRTSQSLRNSTSVDAEHH